MKICQVVPKLLSGNKISGYIKGHNSSTNLRKMTCNNPKLDLAKINAYIKFGEILPIGSQDIERKRNFCINKGPLLWYKFAKNDV